VNPTDTKPDRILGCQISFLMEWPEIQVPGVTLKTP